jgi:AcrR family transcriptional regulator
MVRLDAKPMSIARAQRGRILTAVAEIVCQCGPESLTVAQIVARAGVSRRTFDALFADPADCPVAAFEYAVMLAEKRAGTAYRSQSSWLESMRAGLATVLQLADERPELAWLCIVHALSARGPLTERWRELTQALVDAIELRAPEAVDNRVRPWTAYAVVGEALGTVYERLRAAPTPTLSPLLNPLMALIVGPYLGPAAAQRELTRGQPSA